MSEMPLTIGKYRIVKEVGRGATAVVYMAESADWPVPVAVKLIRFNDKSKDESKWNRRLLKLLKAEQAVSTRLDHPHIIHVHDVVIEAEQAYVVMEYFPGESLERYCSFEHLLPVHRAIGIVFKCCMALDYAYRQGIVHRDIKPANILVDDQDNVKITDFGLALNISKKVESDSTFIMGVGSPAYMSPEQIKGYPLNQKTDLYSLGVVLFNLLTGRLPFRASNPAQLIYKIINADPPRVSQLNPELPEQIDAVIRKALEKDLYSRYKNGAEFAKELSTVRYQLVDDTYVPPDTSRFSLLRKLAFFTEFDDVELWEVLRISAWRVVDCGTTLIREGDADQRFGVVVDGEVELSVDGRRVTRLGVGEVFGEIAWLDSVGHRHMTTVTSANPTTYLEVNPSALALATDELRERFRAMLATIAVRRLGEALRDLSANGEPAMVSKFTASGLDLQLVED
ncbi:serine/threonine-protein kinase [Aromatoleum toluclasticum]|uniref:serine/threonine-protein kinase n=1 Tax=Aromatoleum toluclasticum TaxID=92003 RepID=UPI001D19811B|nr:serine/threonine-protein kinase [Aromatoleum toluclasticum]MCC4116724.1 serine/threonine-protein kinase [Aromatoleum toluclasticum]